MDTKVELNEPPKKPEQLINDIRVMLSSWVEPGRELNIGVRKIPDKGEQFRFGIESNGNFLLSRVNPLTGLHQHLKNCKSNQRQ